MPRPREHIDRLHLADSIPARAKESAVARQRFGIAGNVNNAGNAPAGKFPDQFRRGALARRVYDYDIRCGRRPRVGSGKQRGC